MRNAVLTTLLVTSTVLAGCSSDLGSPAEPGATPSEDPSSASAPPSSDLAGATVSSTGTPRVDLEAAREAARLGEQTTSPAAPADPAPGPPADPTDPTPATPPPPAQPAGPDPGPAPTGACTITKDAEGFFVRNSGKSDYVAYVPASYSPSQPMRAIVGLHGCGDNMANFARWGVNPFDTRSTQDHIGISVGGESGGNKCWSMGGDDDKVLAAVDDLAKCFWIHRAKVVVAGFSSGGQLAYRVGMKHADRFAGILIEHASLYAADSNPDGLLAGAAWKINVAHRAATGDTVFPIAKVRADWTKTTAAGFPLVTTETGGGHDGSSNDWTGWLIPQSAGWTKP